MTATGEPGAAADGDGANDRTRLEPPDERQLLGHDIRAAVSDVIGGLRLVDPDTLPPGALAQFDRVRAASELLARLVEELLGGARRDTVGAVGNLNLARFLDDELRRWHGAAEGTGIKVTLDRAAGLPDIVRLDLLQLRRVVSNLMGNALRHSGGTRVNLGADVYADGTLSICVTDDGAGFPDAVLDGHFRKAGSGAGSGSVSGSGLGLRIARAHADAIGGTLRARNRAAGGARATLNVPRTVWDGPAAEPGAMPDLSGARILVAEDSATNRTLIEAMLTRLGAECEMARDGIEALNWLSRERFDLALVDIEMPLLGGLEVMRSERLRQARGIAPPTSMIAMTAYVLRDNREAIMAAGADGILAKPLDGLEEFGRALRHWLDRAPDLAGWCPETAPALSAATLAELMLAAGPDHEADLLLRLTEDLALVEGRMAEAVAARDGDALAAQVHVLLSLASAVGALPTQAAARELEARLPALAPGAMAEAAAACLARLAKLRAELARTA